VSYQGVFFFIFKFFGVTYRYIGRYVLSLRIATMYPHCLTKKLLYPLFQYAII
jgi:hypothetical protein